MQDGQFTHRIVGQKHEREYQVTLKEPVTPEVVATFAAGTLMLEKVRCA